MNFYKNNKNKILISFLIFTILFSYILQGFYMGTNISNAVPTTVLPVAEEVIIALLATLGVSSVQDVDYSNSDMRIFVNNYLGVGALENFLFENMRNFLELMKIYSKSETAKWTRRQIINKFLEHFTVTSEGTVDIDDDGNIDNKVVTFKDEEALKAFLKDIISDLYATGITKDKESALKYFKDLNSDWVQFPATPKSVSKSYPYRYIFHEKVFNTPIDDPDWNAIGEFPFDTFGDKLISYYPEGFMIYKVPLGLKFYKYDKSSNRSMLRANEYFDYVAYRYRIANNSWSEINASYNSSREFIDYFNVNDVLYFPNNIYSSKDSAVKIREKDNIFIDSQDKYEENVKMVCSQLPLRYGYEQNIPVREYTLEGNKWRLTYESENYIIKNLSIYESNYDILDINNNIYFRKTTIDNIDGMTFPAEYPFNLGAEQQPRVWSDERSISIPNMDSATFEDFIKNLLTEAAKNAIMTNDSAIAMEMPLDDAMSYNPPYDDTQVVTGLGTISQWLNKIWEAIQTGVNAITESTTADPTEPDLSEKATEYSWPDFFLCIWHVLVACIGLILRAGVFLVSLFSVEPDSSLLNVNIIEGLEFFKNQQLPVFGITFWNAISAVFTLLISIFVVKKANNFV